MSDTIDDNGFSRREVLALSQGLLVLGAAPMSVLAAPAVTADEQSPVRKTVTSKVSFKVNGERRELELDNRTSLLDAMREHLHLTGSKKGCDQGQCGACTMIVDGQRINGCLTLAIMHQGAEITTIEGLGTPESMHPMQAAFVKHDGFQCGYCTPGQICSAVSVLEEIKQGIPSHVSGDITAAPTLNVDEMRERMSGNLCRCGAYSNIIDAMSEEAGGRA